MSESAEPTPVPVKPPSPQKPGGNRVLAVVFRLVLITVLLGIGIGGSKKIMSLKPKAEQKPRPPMQALVRVSPVQPTNRRVTVTAMGTVIPADEVALKARVSGHVVSVAPAFSAGGRFRQGDVMLALDPLDYEIAVARAQAALVRAEFELQLEQGRQQIAQREWAVLGGGDEATDLELELALRKPQLRQVSANLDAARADLRLAQANLDRTRIKAPFHAVVRERMANLGSQVSPQETLARLVGTDSYWVQVSVPADRLNWIRLPEGLSGTGAPATVIQEAGGARTERPGRVLRLLSDLDPLGRMARILVEVEDPLALQAERAGQPPLLLGSYVRIEIEGAELEQVVAIPRSAFRNGHQAWVADDDDQLAIRDILVVWRDRREVLVRRGLDAGDRLVVSDIPAPIEGLPLKVLPAGESASSDVSGDPPAIPIGEPGEGPDPA